MEETESSELTLSQYRGLDQFLELYPPDGEGAFCVLTTADIERILGEHISLNNLDVHTWLDENGYQTRLQIPPLVGIGWQVYPSFPAE